MELFDDFRIFKCQNYWKTILIECDDVRGIRCCIDVSLLAEEYKLMFWNVKNLFNTIDDLNKENECFNPNFL